MNKVQTNNTEWVSAFIYIRFCFGWKAHSQVEIKYTKLPNTHFVWPLWVKLLSHTTLALTLFPCNVLRQSVHPSQQTCPFIPFRIAVNSWSQPWLELIRLPDTMDAQERQISKQPMRRGTYIDSFTSRLHRGKLVSEMKSHIVNWFKWESHTHTQTLTQNNTNAFTITKSQMKSRQFEHTHTHTHSSRVYSHHIQTLTEHNCTCENWGGQKLIRSRSHERNPESSVNDLNRLRWDYTYASFLTHWCHNVSLLPEKHIWN